MSMKARRPLKLPVFPACCNCGATAHKFMAMQKIGMLSCPPQVLVKCVRCDYASVITITEGTAEEAIAAWNRREASSGK